MSETPLSAFPVLGNEAGSKTATVPARGQIDRAMSGFNALLAVTPTQTGSDYRGT